MHARTASCALSRVCKALREREGMTASLPRALRASRAMLALVDCDLDEETLVDDTGPWNLAERLRDIDGVTAHVVSQCSRTWPIGAGAPSDRGCNELGAAAHALGKILRALVVGADGTAPEAA